jgi:hypothetical protein
VIIRDDSRDDELWEREGEVCEHNKIEEKMINLRGISSCNEEENHEPSTKETTTEQ